MASYSHCAHPSVKNSSRHQVYSTRSQSDNNVFRQFQSAANNRKLTLGQKANWQKLCHVIICYTTWQLWRSSTVQDLSDGASPVRRQANAGAWADSEVLALRGSHKVLEVTGNNHNHSAAWLVSTAGGARAVGVPRNGLNISWRYWHLAALPRGWPSAGLARQPLWYNVISGAGVKCGYSLSVTAIASTTVFISYRHC